MISSAGRAAEPTVSHQIASPQRDGNINRRKVLTMTTLATATAMTSVPFGSNGRSAIGMDMRANPDAELLDLCSQLDQLHAQLKAWFREQEEAYERYKPLEPPMPEALRVRSGDRDLELPVPDEWKPELKKDVPTDWYNGRVVGELKRQPRTKREEIPIVWGDGKPVVWSKHSKEIAKNREVLVKEVPWPEAQARADEIVAAFGSWQSERKAIGCSVGLDDTNDVTDAFYEKIQPLEGRIIEMPAKTLEGFRAKARAVVYSYSSPEELAEEFTNTSVSHDIAWSLIRDLRQLA
jgi:hypothetical protein